MASPPPAPALAAFPDREAASLSSLSPQWVNLQRSGDGDGMDIAMAGRTERAGGTARALAARNCPG
jgi:hypothetical protein